MWGKAKGYGYKFGRIWDSNHLFWVSFFLSQEILRRSTCVPNMPSLLKSWNHQVVFILKSINCPSVDFQFSPLSQNWQVKLPVLEKKPLVHLWRVPNATRTSCKSLCGASYARPHRYGRPLMNHLLPQVRDGFGKKDMNRGWVGKTQKDHFAAFSF